MAVLLARSEWRDSPNGSVIAEHVEAALHDPNPLVRMAAASGARFLMVNEPASVRVARLGALLMEEQQIPVRSTLLSAICRDAISATAQVDQLVDQLLLESDLLADEDFLANQLVELLAWLALEDEAPLAEARVIGWFSDAPMNERLVSRAAHHLRDALTSLDAERRRRAFDLMRAAVDSSVAVWANGDKADDGLAEEQLGPLRAAAQVAHSIAQQIYFASGAHSDASAEDSEGDRSSMTDFAIDAIPLLVRCAEVPVPQVLHPIVQTLVFLAPTDERRALITLAAAVPHGSVYASDSLAAAEVMSYLERLLATHRSLVLHDEDGVAAFRHLLATFAVAGDDRALTLAYTFSDLFR